LGWPIDFAAYVDDTYRRYAAEMNDGIKVGSATSAFRIAALSYRIGIFLDRYSALSPPEIFFCPGRPPSHLLADPIFLIVKSSLAKPTIA
jgi:hypothetical protein